MHFPINGLTSKVYVGCKGDEMEIGLIECSAYQPTKWMKGTARTLVYYGGRGWGRGWGGWQQEQQLSQPQGVLECSCRGRDCTRGGSIQGGPTDSTILHPIPKYGAGSWLTFKIDFDAKTVEFYKNGEHIYKSDPNVFPKEQCYFVGQMDTGRDWFYVEEDIADF